MTLSLRLPSGTPIETFRQAAILAERVGFDQIWTGNDLFKPSGLVPVTVALDSTSRIRVGSSVLNPVSLSVAEIASFASQLQELSHGRYLLGLGAGSDVYLGWAGMAADKPAPRTARAVQELRALLDGRSPAEDGHAGWATTARLQRPTPYRTPIYVGGMGPHMLRAAGRYADGAIALALPPERIGWVRDQVSRGQAARTEPGPFDLACALWVSIDEDAAGARAMLADRIAQYCGSLSREALAQAGYDVDRLSEIQRLSDSGRHDEAVRLVDDALLRLGVAGNAHDVTDQCLALADDGVRHLSFGHPLGRDPMEAIRVLGEHVIPAVEKEYA
ncbi:LLM class flavin-dependent oxidoreductase [Microbacterium sp. ZXX196]|uniref:LLM class flavin-dependent oxidoreductase n=1 Tax=Microbacterium sp. ZXX196 TaxID=2609291 RepID=UPI0012B76636|nr:LLM class flavin-dependent oxidoreductase [Microbacterium sp. ZXX196]MTE24234.1 LLM class flavin-dependent oxidoreductase [Microbacterium sp. ZXX196]